MNGSLTSFDHFLSLLVGDLEVFRYPVLDLARRYGAGYKGDLLFVLRKIEEFALLQGETLGDGLAFYRGYIEQVVGERRSYQDASIPHRQGALDEGEPCWRDYLYALAFSTVLNRCRYELFQDYRRAVRQHVRRGSRILEIGAGNCLDAEFASAYGEVHAYDMNDLSRVWQRLLGLDGRIELSIEKYRFDHPQTYDFVAMVELLEHLADPSEYLQGAYSVLKEDGLAYFTFAIRMPQFDHLYDFTSIEECRDLVYAHGFQLIRDHCLLDTYMPFEEDERWRLGADPRYSVIYCCLTRKGDRGESARQMACFNEELER